MDVVLAMYKLSTGKDKNKVRTSSGGGAVKCNFEQSCETTLKKSISKQFTKLQKEGFVSFASEFSMLLTNKGWLTHFVSKWGLNPSLSTIAGERTAYNLIF